MCVGLAGWNDPPLFSYQSKVKPSNKKGPLLNKRPPYPADKVLASTATSSVSSAQSKHPDSLPPLVDSQSSSSLEPPPLVPQCTDVSESEELKQSSPTDRDRDSLLTHDEMVTYLNQLLDEHKESLQVRDSKTLFIFKTTIL